MVSDKHVVNLVFTVYQYLYGICIRTCAPTDELFGIPCGGSFVTCWESCGTALVCFGNLIAWAVSENLSLFDDEFLCDRTAEKLQEKNCSKTWDCKTGLVYGPSKNLEACICKYLQRAVPQNQTLLYSSILRKNCIWVVYVFWIVKFTWRVLLIVTVRQTMILLNLKFLLMF